MDYPDAGRRHPSRQPVFQTGNLSPIIFLTVCTKNRREILAGERAHELLVAAWRQADAFSVGKYVVLPDHIHLFCAPAVLDHLPLENWVRYWKSLFRKSFGPAETGNFWQSGFWDTQLRRSESYGAKWEYVRLNPVRHGLVDEPDAWPYQGELSILEWHDK